MYKNYSELGAQNDETQTNHYSVFDVKTQEIKENIIENNRLVCVDIYAKWCGPCTQTEPDYAMVAQTYNKKGMCAIVKEDWANKITPNIESLPTYLFYLDGKQIDNVIGADVSAVEQKIKLYLQQIQNNSSGPMYSNANTENLGGPQFNRNSIRNYRTPNSNASLPQENNQNYYGNSGNFSGSSFGAPSGNSFPQKR